MLAGYSELRTEALTYDQLRAEYPDLGELQGRAPAGDPEHADRADRRPTRSRRFDVANVNLPFIGAPAGGAGRAMTMIRDARPGPALAPGSP